MKNILVINAGSSSVKFSIFENRNHQLQANLTAKAIKLFKTDAEFHVNDEVIQLHEVTGSIADHKVAIQYFLDWLGQQTAFELVAVGHRVVHGGIQYTKPIKVDEAVLKDLQGLVSLAPLHQAHNLYPIKIIQKNYPELPQIACFDTAFHTTQSDLENRFAIAETYFKQGVRRYGFHGLSYEYITDQLQGNEDISDKNIVIAHLGNGASMCAIKDLKSISTTMSFSPLDGLMMGTRCGDLDPAVVLHLQQEFSLSVDEISDLLYRQSGLLGISGESNNMRTLLASDSGASQRAIQMFCHQVNKHLGALVAVLGGLDNFIFTAGIGENSAVIRRRVCELAHWAGITLDNDANQQNASVISAADSQVKVHVMSTDEARMIAKHVLQIIEN